jgi:acyl carrier protein
MGLDGVELIIEIEEHFGVTISDAESQEIVTVGDMLSLINARVEGSRQSRCHAFEAFLQVRRFIRDFLQEPKRRMRPSDQIASIIPWHRRREFWLSLNKLFRTWPTPLRLPQPLRLFDLLISVSALAVGASTAFLDAAILPLGIISAVAFVILLQLILTPLKIEPPAQLASLGDFSLRLVGLSAATKPPATSDEILNALQKIVADTLGVDRDEVVPEASFVKDLEMN